MIHTFYRYIPVNSCANKQVLKSDRANVSLPFQSTVEASVRDIYNFHFKILPGEGSCVCSRNGRGGVRWPVECKFLEVCKWLEVRIYLLIHGKYACCIQLYM